MGTKDGGEMEEKDVYITAEHILILAAIQNAAMTQARSLGPLLVRKCRRGDGQLEGEPCQLRTLTELP